MSISAKGFKFPNSNLYFHGTKHNVNGNKVLQFSFSGGRKFSIYPSAFGYYNTIYFSKGDDFNEFAKDHFGSVENFEKQIVSYIVNRGTEMQKNELYYDESKINFACGKGNFGISNNPNYVGDWYGEGQIDKEKILNNDGEGDVYLVKIWSGSGYALDVYLVRAIDSDEAIDIVFEWSRKNEKDMIFSREEVEKFAKDAWKDYGKGKGGKKEVFIEDFIDTEFIASSDYNLFARSDNFFVDKVPQEGDNFSIKGGGILMF